MYKNITSCFSIVWAAVFLYAASLLLTFFYPVHCFKVFRLSVLSFESSKYSCSVISYQVFCQFLSTYLLHKQLPKGASSRGAEAWAKSPGVHGYFKKVTDARTNKTYHGLNCVGRATVEWWISHLSE